MLFHIVMLVKRCVAIIEKIFLSKVINISNMRYIMRLFTIIQNAPHLFKDGVDFGENVHLSIGHNILFNMKYRCCITTAY